MTTQPLRPTCTDGTVTVLTADGPETSACLGPCCVPAITKRYVEPGFTAAMLADIPDEEIF